MTDGTDSVGRHVQYSEEDIIGAIQRADEELESLTAETYRIYRARHNAPALSVISERFGSWVEAKEAAGVGGDKRHSNPGKPRQYSDEELFKMLRTCKRRHGVASQSNFDADDSLCASGTLVKRFGSWSVAKEKAGVE